MRLHRQNAGFTLIELMLVVAIIGILAAIAIPNFARLQLRARAAEGKTNVAAIRTAQEGYYAEFSTYVACSANPASTPSSQKRPWTDVGGYINLGFAPEGDVYFNYGVAVGPSSSPYDRYTVEAVSDLDGDTQLNAFGYVKNSPSGSSVAGNTSGDATVDCPTTGAWNPQSGSRQLGTLGPCMPDFGSAVF